LRASQIITLESFPSDHSSASFFQPRERFPQNVDALRLEFVEVVHRGRRQAVVGQDFRRG
jgi:hypothetical protein